MNKGIVVLVPGVLKGPGGETECEVLARRVTTDESSKRLQKYAYTDCTVLGASENLADGDFVLHFDGFSPVVTRNRAGWLPFGPPVKDSLQVQK
jgi:hypothetical protein